MISQKDDDDDKNQMCKHGRAPCPSLMQYQLNNVARIFPCNVSLYSPSWSRRTRPTYIDMAHPVLLCNLNNKSINLCSIKAATENIINCVWLLSEEDSKFLLLGKSSPKYSSSVLALIRSTRIYLEMYTTCHLHVLDDSKFILINILGMGNVLKMISSSYSLPRTWEALRQVNPFRHCETILATSYRNDFKFVHTEIIIIIANYMSNFCCNQTLAKIKCII